MTTTPSMSAERLAAKLRHLVECGLVHGAAQTIEEIADHVEALAPTAKTGCPFCGCDPFHRVDNGVCMEAVAVTCCELGNLLYRGARPAPEEVTLGWDEFVEIASRLALASQPSQTDTGVTDEMVERACEALARRQFRGWWPSEKQVAQAEAELRPEDATAIRGFIASNEIWVRQRARELEGDVRCVLSALTPTPQAQTGWRTIDSAPPRGWRDDPGRVILFVPDWGGVREGRAWRDPDGAIHSDVSNVNGDIGATHWMPLPSPPTPQERE